MKVTEFWRQQFINRNCRTNWETKLLQVYGKRWMNIKRTNYGTCLFDLDGTLTDSQPGIIHSVQYALEKLGIVESDPRKLLPFIGPPLAQSFSEFYGFDASQAIQAVGFYREYYKETGIFENRVYEGIPALLAELRQADYTLAVATSKPTIFTERILNHFQMRDFFEVVIGSNLDGTRTAKAEVIALVLRELKPSSQKPVMIGDRRHDIYGAQENGLDSIAAAYGYGTVAELETAKPTHLVRSVAELRELLVARRFRK